MKHLLLCLDQKQISTAFHLITERFVSSMSPVCVHCTWKIHRLYDNAVSIAYITSLVAREKSFTFYQKCIHQHIKRQFLVTRDILVPELCGISSPTKMQHLICISITTFHAGQASADDLT